MVLGWRRLGILILAGATGGASSSADIEAHAMRLRMADLEALLIRQQAILDRQHDQLAALEADEPPGIVLDRLWQDEAWRRPSIHGSAHKGVASQRRLQDEAWRVPSVHGSTYEGRRAYTVNENISSALSMAWSLLCGFLVMFMQAGFAMMEVGYCRAKKVQHILAKHLINICVCAIAWLFTGWAMSFAGPYEGSGLKKYPYGFEDFFASGFWTEPQPGFVEPTPKATKWFFHWAVCTLSASIMSAGGAERAGYLGQAMVSFGYAGFIYPIVVASLWGKGWLVDINATGPVDVGGSGIVHLCGGSAGLIAILVCGPRNNRWKKPEEFKPHHLPLVVMGTFIVWFGWYGLNCGLAQSTATISDGFVAGHVAMTTTLAAASGGVTAFLVFLAVRRGERSDLYRTCKGIIAGLVSVSSGCANMTWFAALAVGCVGSLLYLGAARLFRKCKLDDPMDVVSVFGVCGMWGLVSAGVWNWFMTSSMYLAPSGWACLQDENGCRSNAWIEVLAANMIHLCFAYGWSLFTAFLLFFHMRLVRLLRPTARYNLDYVPPHFHIETSGPKSKWYDI
mmetsp:Transcript_55858/g.161771  ORF Transcript_55858/g.161771 Transcript_55858/m.161771 type:complete len:565 (-) Transcript_55858:94-1788(-)